MLKVTFFLTKKELFYVKLQGNYKVNINKKNPWPNLKNLSGGLDISRRSNLVGST